MAILVAISISLPADLIAAHCSMDSPAAEMPADHCPMTASHQHEKSHDQNDCDWILSCACDISKTEVKPEAVPSVSKNAKAFVISVIQYLDVEQPSPTTFTVDIGLSLNNHFPPIFLLNSVFLN
jgi:hypothetical protein